MKNFKEFLNICEVLDAEKIQKIDAEISLDPYIDNSYKYKFKINKEEYEIGWKKHRISVSKEGDRFSYNDITNKGYEVVFYGPQSSVALTNKRIATQVYSHLLAGMKKFIEEVKPEGLYFYGAYEGMDLMYNRFVKKFLSEEPNKPDHMIFYQIDEKQYVSKKCLNKLEPEMQEKIKIHINQWQEKEVQFIQNKKAEKVTIREKFKQLVKSIGSFIFDEYDGYFGIVYAASPNEVQAIVNSWNGLKKRNFNAYNLLDQDNYGKKLFKPYEVFAPEFFNKTDNLKKNVMNFLDNLFDPENYKKNEEYIKLIRQNIPQEIINYIAKIYYKMADVEKRSKITTVKTPLKLPINPSRQTPSMPRHRPIMQTWQRYPSSALRSGEFEDE